MRQIGLARQPPWRWPGWQQAAQPRGTSTSTHCPSQSTPAPGMCRAHTVSLDAAQGPASWKLVLMLTSPRGVEGWGWGQTQASQAFLLHSWGPCLPSSLPQPGHKLFQAYKIGSVALLLTVFGGGGLGPGQETHSTHRTQRVLGQLGQRKLGDLLGTNILGSTESGAWPTPQGRAPLPRNCAQGKEKWLGGQASMCLRVQHWAKDIETDNLI